MGKIPQVIAQTDPGHRVENYIDGRSLSRQPLTAATTETKEEVDAREVSSKLRATCVDINEL